MNMAKCSKWEKGVEGQVDGERMNLRRWSWHRDSPDEQDEATLVLSRPGRFEQQVHQVHNNGHAQQVRSAGLLESYSYAAGQNKNTDQLG
jgi:hypothetical protein